MEAKQRTRIDRIDIAEDGTLSPRIKMQVLVDGEVVKDVAYRRLVQPDENAEEVMAVIDTALEQQGFDALSADDKAMMSEIAGRKHTPEVKSAFATKREIAEIRPNSSPRAR